ncbi:MAG TPA: hypothetical protein V6C57_06620 [Coleofasciculaceae cyanobacterium]
MTIYQVYCTRQIVQEAYVYVEAENEEDAAEKVDYSCLNWQNSSDADDAEVEVTDITKAPAVQKSSKRAQTRKDIWIAKGKLTYLPDYAGISWNEVASKIMRKATEEGFKGKIQDRLLELQWDIVMVRILE